MHHHSCRATISSGLICRLLAATASLSASMVAFGQSVPAASAPKAPAKSEAIILNPFQVQADASDTYEATNTNSITGTNTPLGKTPLDAQVFNRQLMDEQGIVDLTAMLSDLGGFGGAFLGGGTDIGRGGQPGDGQDPKSIRMRGLTSNNPRRDGFLRSETSLLDSFDVERVEALEGSNSLLFGSGDAGGIITVSGKRAMLRRTFLRAATTFDSEQSYRQTIDANVGNSLVALRVNGVIGETKFYRPILAQRTDGLQLAATVQPLPGLTLRGEFRKYQRDGVTSGQNNQAVFSAPAALQFRLPNGTVRALNGLEARYVLGLPGGVEQIDNLFSYSNSDSLFGGNLRQNWSNESKGVTLEHEFTRDLAIQLRYGHDARINHSAQASSSSIYHATAAGNPTGTWAIQNTPTASDTITGARGYRAALVYSKDLRRLGKHQLSAFRQDSQFWSYTIASRFYELDGAGQPIQNSTQLANAESGRNLMPVVWTPVFSETIAGTPMWRWTKSALDGLTLTHPNGRIYKELPRRLVGAVPATAANPLGLSGNGVNDYLADSTRESSYGIAAFSEFWGGRINTMTGIRVEEASQMVFHTGFRPPPVNYDSVTLGAVFATPVSGLRGYFNHASNGKFSFSNSRDIYDNFLPPGKGVSDEVGFKFELFGDRLSGNLNYYISEALNFSAALGGFQNDVDPPGINGRNARTTATASYLYNIKSDGVGVTLTAKPTRSWEVRLNYTLADGSERSNVSLPSLYNDEFNTMSVGGQTVVAVKNAATGATTPFTVPRDPADPSSPLIPLSLQMLKDPLSPYFAKLDLESGYILNATDLGLLTPGIGTGRTGLPISDHQLGFVSPTSGVITVRRAGEPTVGYAQHSFSLVNRYQLHEGRLKGLVLGLTSVVQRQYRGYAYTDAADAGKRKIFFFPDRATHNIFVTYNFRAFSKWRTTVQLNVSNVFDSNRIVYMVRQTNGDFRFAREFMAPRLSSLTFTVAY